MLEEYCIERYEFFLPDWCYVLDEYEELLKSLRLINGVYYIVRKKSNSELFLDNF